MFVRIDDGISISGQLVPEDVAHAAAEGIRLLVNNRPDDEAPDQPPGAEIEAAAQAGYDVGALMPGMRQLAAQVR
jgi:uncharacterized protein (TIGR01244 family)